MAKYREVDGTYGGSKTPSTIFVSDNRDGSHWYVAEGSVNVNKTHDDIEDGVDIEELSDVDVFTASKPIKSLDDLEKFLEDEEYAKGGKAGENKNDLAGLFDKLKSYLDQSYSQMSNPQMAIGEWIGGESSMDAGARTMFEKLGVDLGTEYKGVELPSMAVEKWVSENKIKMECGGNMDYEKGGKVSSSDLMEKIKKSGKITEQEINLIKNRMNAGRLDAEGKELVQWIWDNTPELTPEQNKKALDFLMNLWKSPTGKERVNSPYGYREQAILEKFSNLELAGFHDISRYGGSKFYVPLYNVVGNETSFQYYYDGKVNIIGAKGGAMAGKQSGEDVKKKNLKKGDSVQIIGRRWFDKVNGNTYHSADVYVNNEFVGRQERTYGYGDHYVQSGMEILRKHYRLPEKFEKEKYLSNYELKEYGINILSTVSDVARKKDLEKGGSIGHDAGNFNSHYTDDGALIFGGSYFESSPVEKKSLGGLLIGLGLGAVGGYAYRGEISKAKEKAKWKAIYGIERLGKGGKSSGGSMAKGGEVETVGELYAKYQSKYPNASDLIAYFIFGNKESDNIVSQNRSKYSELSKFAMDYEYNWQHNMSDIENGVNEIIEEKSSGGSMAKGGKSNSKNEIKYKGKVITRLFPSGYYEFYSDKQERFLKFDDLDRAKSVIDSEKD